MPDTSCDNQDKPELEQRLSLKRYGCRLTRVETPTTIYTSSQVAILPSHKAVLQCYVNILMERIKTPQAVQSYVHKVMGNMVVIRNR